MVNQPAPDGRRRTGGNWTKSGGGLLAVFISEKLSEGSRLLAIGIHAGKANDQPRPGLPFG